MEILTHSRIYVSAVAKELILKFSFETTKYLTDSTLTKLKFFNVSFIAFSFLNLCNLSYLFLLLALCSHVSCVVCVSFTWTSFFVYFFIF